MISNDLENINSLPEILFKYNRKFPHKKFLFKKNTIINGLEEVIL